MDPSSLVTGDATIHVDLPPAALSDPTAGVASALAARLLRWCPDLGGVLLSYGGVELERGGGDASGSSDLGSTHAPKAGKGKGKTGEKSSSSNDDGSDFASSSAEISDYFAFVRVRAVVRDALVFAPAPAMRLEGTVARVGGDYVGVLVLGVFSAAVGGAALSSRYELREVDVDVEEEAEVKDGGGDVDKGAEATAAAAAAATKTTKKAKKKKVKAWVHKSDPSQKLSEGARVLFDVSRVRRSDGGFVSILGSVDADGTGVVSGSAAAAAAASAPAAKSKKTKRGDDKPSSSPASAAAAASAPVEQPSSKRKKTESKGDEKKKDKEKKKETKKKAKK